MTIDQAMKVIEQNLDFYLNPIPTRLLKRIREVVISCKTILKPEYIAAKQMYEPPDLPAEWEKICAEYKVNSETALKGRQHKYISIRCHFVRRILTDFNASVISLSELGRFLGRDHSMIIYYRDYSKVDCVLPPLGISKWSPNSRKVNWKPMKAGS